MTLNNPPYNNRLLGDAYYVGSTLTDSAVTSFDLVQASPYPITEQVQLVVVSTASGSGASTFTVKDSADNVTFTEVSLLGSATLNAVPSGSSPSSSAWLLPPTIRRYVQVSGSVVATSGSYTVSLSF